MMRWWPLLLVGCIENGLRGGSASIAVTWGDFDDLTPSLDRLSVEHGAYEGLISNATWTDDLVVGEPVEDLLLNNGARLHQGLWIAGGTRGLGNTVYNRNDPDDALLAEESLDTVRRFVGSRKNLLVTDWAYDLAEQAWPDQVEYYGDDRVFDAAQVGNIGTIVARVTDPELATALGMEQLVVDYNFSNWAVITGVGPEVTVYLRGDVEAWDGNAWETLQDVPLLVSFEPEGRTGRVVVMSFHGNAQPAAVTDTLLSSLLGPLPAAKP